MIRKILYYLANIVIIVISLMHYIGFRGVYYDPFLTEVEKNKFLFEYGTIVMVSLLFWAILICLRKKF